MFYELIYDANQLPIIGDPSTAPIDNCFYFDSPINVQLPTINGVQYSGLCVETRAQLDAFLLANNLYLDTEANYYFNLPT
jgi:hypothetical protein